MNLPLSLQVTRHLIVKILEQMMEIVNAKCTIKKKTFGKNIQNLRGYSIIAVIP